MAGPATLEAGPRGRLPGQHHRRCARHVPPLLRRSAGARRAAAGDGCASGPETSRQVATPGAPAGDRAPAQASAPARTGGAPGPGAAQVCRRRPRPALVHRHHRTPHRRWEGVLLRRPGRLLPPGGRLVHRRSHAFGPGCRRPTDGHLAPPTRRRHHRPLRPAAASTPPGCSGTGFGPLGCSGRWAGSPRPWTTR